MIYRVHEGEIILWPDGSIRAADGQTFDGYDTEGTAASREYAQAILGRQAPKCYIRQEDQGSAPEVDIIPDSIRDHLAEMAGGDFEAVKSVVKKKATKKKASKKPAAERLADPEE